MFKFFDSQKKNVSLRKKYGVLNNMAVHEKCLVDSTSRENEQNGLMQFLKLCLNLCSWRWLKPNLNLVNNLRLKGWWILYIKSGVGQPSLVFLNFLKDFSLRNRKSSLFHSRMEYGKKDYLKAFVLQNYVPTEYVERVSYMFKRYQFIEIFRRTLCFYFIKSTKTSKPSTKT